MPSVKILHVCGDHSLNEALGRKIGERSLHGSTGAALTVARGITAGRLALNEPDFHLLTICFKSYAATNRVCGLDLLREVKQNGPSKYSVDGQIIERPGVIVLLAAGSERTDMAADQCRDLGADDVLIENTLQETVADALFTSLAKLASRQVWFPQYDGRPVTRIEVQTGSILRLGILSINLTTQKVFMAKEPVTLTPTEFRLLTVFLRQPGRAFTRAQLTKEVVQGIVESRTIDVHVKSLRNKLAEAAEEADIELNEQMEVIQTVRGVGYRCNESFVGTEI